MAMEEVPGPVSDGSPFGNAQSEQFRSASRERQVAGPRGNEREMALQSWRVWIDTGGTFTDCIAVSNDGEVRRRKVLSSGRLQIKVVESSLDEMGRQRLLVASSPGTPPDFFDGFTVGVPSSGFNAGGPLKNALDSTGATARVIQHTSVPDTEESGTDIGTVGTGTAAIRNAEVDRLDQLTLDRVLELGGTVELWNGFEAPVLGLHLLFSTRPGDALPRVELRLGTTRGTNALLERKGARCALVVTRGFADLLEIGDQSRPDLFAHEIVKPAPLYESVVEIDERIAADGAILHALESGSELSQRLAELAESGIESAAVSLLHGYRAPEHERKVADVLSGSSIKVSMGSDLSGLAGYLPRTQTAVVDAYLAPIFERYLTSIKDSTGQQFKVMSSAGGLVEAGAYRAKDSLLSGPAGGVMGCLEACRLAGIDHALAFDMGGTSTDVSRIAGDVEYDERHEVGGAIVMAPALAIRTVAAGGGSICSADDGRIKVGPESAGALPGPACYGRGGPLTVTDVNLLLGRIDGARFEVPLDIEASERALKLEQAKINGIESQALLEGFLEVANERMAETISKVSTRRGFDPKDHALVAFGGAGGQHACDLAKLLSVPTILVPDDCSLLSARGIGAAQVEQIIQQQVLLSPQALELEDLIARASAHAVERVMAEHNADGEDLDAEVSTTLNLRYVGQDSGLEVAAMPMATLERRFVDTYRAVFGYAMDREIEVEWLRCRARLPVESLDSGRKRRLQEAERMGSEAKGTRENDGRTILTWEHGQGREVPLVEREEVPWQGEGVVTGPALVTEPYSSTWVASGWTAAREATGAGLLLQRAQADSSTD